MRYNGNSLDDLERKPIIDMTWSIGSNESAKIIFPEKLKNRNLLMYFKNNPNKDDLTLYNYSDIKQNNNIFCNNVNLNKCESVSLFEINSSYYNINNPYIMNKQQHKKYFKEFEGITKNTPDKCKKILAKIGCDICSEISYYMMNEGYDLEQITEIMYSKYKHDVRTTDIEEEKD